MLFQPLRVPVLNCAVLRVFRRVSIVRFSALCQFQLLSVEANGISDAVPVKKIS